MSSSRVVNIPPILEKISNTLNNYNARAVLVGGCVRDHFLNLPIKDYDIEVFGVESLDRLEEILSKFGEVNIVGKSFGVLKLNLDGFEFDFSIPRADIKVGEGHRGFRVDFRPNMEFIEASRRRDFTINSIGFCIKDRIFLDPYGGIRDIKLKLLRYVDRSLFQEDPLRVYRGVQFSSRFDFRVERETFELFLEMVDKNLLDELPKERVYIEFQKLFLKSKKPSVGVELMERLGILDRYFPELREVNLKSLDKITRYKDMELLFALVGFFNKSNIENFIKKLTNKKSLIKRVISLVDTLVLYKSKSHFNIIDIKRLSTRVSIRDFLRLSKSLNKRLNYPQIKRVAKRFGIYTIPLKPIVCGKDLIKLGFTPSKEFGAILNLLYEAQIRGEIRNLKEATAFIYKNSLLSCKWDNPTSPCKPPSKSV